MFSKEKELVGSDVFEKLPMDDDLNLDISSFAKKLPEFTKIAFEYPKTKRYIDSLISSDGLDGKLLLEKDGKVDGVMSIYLTAALLALGKNVKDINDEGLLLPSLFIYKSLANTWDDLFDERVASGEVPDPKLVFESGFCSEEYNCGMELIRENDNLSEENKKFFVDFLEEVKNDYLIHEAMLVKKGFFCDPVDFASLDEFVYHCKRQSFGKTAFYLTLLMAGNSWERNVGVARKMAELALIGGMIDDLLDGDNEGIYNFSSCG